MKNFKVSISVVFIALLLLFSQKSYSQHSGSKNAISINAVGIDYYSLFKDDFSSTEYTTNGFKLGYHRNLVGDILNLEIPLSIGSARVPQAEYTFVNGDSFTDEKLKFSFGGLLQLQLFKESNFIVPYLSAGIVGTSISLDDEWHAEIPLGIGFDFRLKKGIYLQLRPEYRIALNEDDRNNLNLNLGLKFFIGSGKPTPPPVNNDRDKDGVMNKMDKCPDVFGVASLAGCPDADNDGIADAEDGCPTEAGVAKFNGCPDSDNDGLADNNDRCPNEAGPIPNAGCPYGDSDGDGINDNIDACPMDAGAAKYNGCPDSDGDGIANNEDTCPNQKGIPELGGCPDSDKDGLADKDDKCPNEAGSKSNKGCPEVVKEVQEAISFAAKNVQFETGSTRVKKSSYQELDNVGAILAQYPEYNLLISGHTDSIGNKNNNLDLSEKRAEACLKYLMEKGVDVSRMSFSGFGESQPIADNMYEPGRKKNRRVEFSIYRR